MKESYKALANAIAAQQQYEQIAQGETNPAKKQHYLEISHVFKMAVYDIAQLNQQQEETK